MNKQKQKIHKRDKGERRRNEPPSHTGRYQGSDRNRTRVRSKGTLAIHIGGVFLRNHFLKPGKLGSILGVFPNMSLEVTSLSEPLIAVGASPWLFLSVNAHVASEVTLSSETTRALVTRVG